MPLPLIIVAAALIFPSGGHTSPADSVTAPRPCQGRCWHPTIGASFAWQLQGKVRTNASADVIDIDAFDSSSRTVRALHKRGKRVVCYVSGGSHEDWRRDASRFPSAVIGDPLDGWPGERWLDIRQLDALLPIMQARADLCRRKGFDAIEWDNVAGYQSETGFPLTADDQLAYNRALADLSHDRGLAVLLKNDPDQVMDLLPWFDASLVEECFQFRECAAYRPFTRAGKPVFAAEYSLPRSKFCAQARRLRIAASRYPLSLDGRRWPCSWPVE